MDSYERKGVTHLARNTQTVPANAQQLRLLISLYTQLGVDYDPAELAAMTTWEAAERINVLRGRPALSSRQLDTALLDVLRLRAVGEDDPTPPVETPELDNQPSRKRG
jgi:hypothetical protein